VLISFLFNNINSMNKFLNEIHTIHIIGFFFWTKTMIKKSYSLVKNKFISVGLIMDYEYTKLIVQSEYHIYYSFDSFISFYHMTGNFSGFSRGNFLNKTKFSLVNPLCFTHFSFFFRLSQAKHCVSDKIM